MSFNVASRDCAAAAPGSASARAKPIANSRDISIASPGRTSPSWHKDLVGGHPHGAQFAGRLEARSQWQYDVGDEQRAPRRAADVARAAMQQAGVEDHNIAGGAFKAESCRVFDLRRGQAAFADVRGR